MLRLLFLFLVVILSPQSWAQTTNAWMRLVDRDSFRHFLFDRQKERIADASLVNDFRVRRAMPHIPQLNILVHRTRFDYGGTIRAQNTNENIRNSILDSIEAYNNQNYQLRDQDGFLLDSVPPIEIPETYVVFDVARKKFRPATYSDLMNSESLITRRDGEFYQRITSSSRASCRRPLTP